MGSKRPYNFWVVGSEAQAWPNHCSCDAVNHRIFRFLSPTTHPSTIKPSAPAVVSPPQLPNNTHIYPAPLYTLNCNHGRHKRKMGYVIFAIARVQDARNLGLTSKQTTKRRIARLLPLLAPHPSSPAAASSTMRKTIAMYVSPLCPALAQFPPRHAQLCLQY